VKAAPTSCLYILLNRAYAQQEIDFVTALAEQSGVAIQRAIDYSKIEKA
jgi:GAF domain-containing protein